MSAIDMVISEDDSRFQDMVEEYGLVVARHQMDQFNFACALLTGFEMTVAQLQSQRTDIFLAPFESLTRWQC